MGGSKPESNDLEGNNSVGMNSIGEFGRFARIIGTALCASLLLFFVDIVAALAAFTLGTFYAVAVLFGIRSVDTLSARAWNSASRVVLAVGSVWQKGYRYVRREVRKQLED